MFAEKESEQEKQGDFMRLSVIVVVFVRNPEAMYVCVCGKSPSCLDVLAKYLINLWDSVELTVKRTTLSRRWTRTH